MRNKKFILLLSLILAFTSVKAQYREGHALSFYMGYGFFKSDFGARRDWRTNITNNATEFGVKAYFNLYPSKKKMAQHFRFYGNMDIIFSHLTHEGYWADGDSPNAKKLQAMTADPFLIGLGAGSEYWFRNLWDFDLSRYGQKRRINAYVGLSLNLYYYKPHVKSSLGNINDPTLQPQILHPRFVNHVYNSGGFAFAAGFKFGVSFPISYYLHIYWENPFLWFPGDKVDGLDVNDSADKYSDWIYTPVIGLTYIIQ